MATDTRHYLHAYFRKRRTATAPPGPTLARMVIEQWSDGWCCTRKSRAHPDTEIIDEGMEFLNKATYEEIYFSPTSQQWEAVTQEES